ncbi:hypothetical protein ABZP36_011538 [Zizania latifolia]
MGGLAGAGSHPYPFFAMPAKERNSRAVSARIFLYFSFSGQRFRDAIPLFRCNTEDHCRRGGGGGDLLSQLDNTYSESAAAEDSPYPQPPPQPQEPQLQLPPHDILSWSSESLVNSGTCIAMRGRER